LHLAVDAGTGEIVASVLTDNRADDAGEVPALLGQIAGEIASVTADGAYDGEPVYRAVASRQPDPPPDVVVPPRSSAVPSTETGGPPSQRDRHVRLIAERGRMAWQRATGYGRRSLAETAVGRFKAIIGPRLRARGLPAQQGEAAIAVRVLNRMIRVAKPVSVRVA
jgi:transposase